MKRSLQLKWKKINPKSLIIFARCSLTISGVLLFLVWLMFLTHNLNVKTDNNIAAIVQNWPLQVSIWPITFIILFVVIMPIWVTTSFEILSIFLCFSLLFLLLNFVFLAFIIVSALWILWLVVDIIAVANVFFVIFCLQYLNKHNKMF